MFHARQNLIYTANVPLVQIKQMSSIKCKIRALGNFPKRYKCAVLLCIVGWPIIDADSPFDFRSLQLTRNTREMRVLHCSAAVLQCCSAALCMIWSRQMFLVDQSHTCLAVTCHVSRVTCHVPRVCCISHTSVMKGTVDTSLPACIREACIVTGDPPSLEFEARGTMIKSEAGIYGDTINKCQ